MIAPFNFSVHEIHEMFNLRNYDAFISDTDDVFKNDILIEINGTNKRILYYFESNFIDFQYYNRYFRADRRSLNTGDQYFSKIEKSFTLNDIKISKNKFNDSISVIYNGDQINLQLVKNSNQTDINISLSDGIFYSIIEKYDSCSFIFKHITVDIKNNGLVIKNANCSAFLIDYDFQECCVLELLSDEFTFSMQLKCTSAVLENIYIIQKELKNALKSTEKLYSPYMKKLSYLVEGNNASIIEKMY